MFGASRLGLVAIVLVMVAASAYISERMYSHQQSLSDSSRYDLAWSTSQAASEYLRLQLAVARVQQGGTTEEVSLRYDIMINRLQILSAGEAAAFLAAHPAQSAAIRRAAAILAQTKALLDHIDQPEVAAQVDQRLALATSALIGLASIAHRYAADRIADDEATLFFLHWMFTALVALLICCGVALIILLSRRMGELRATKGTLEQTASRLATALAEADAGNRAKSTFLATMSHEIRTPLNAMLGLTTSLLDDLKAGPHRKPLETIHDAGRNLLRLLNDILDFSKLDAGRMTLEETAFSPAAVASNVASVLECRASAKSIGLVLRTDPGLPSDLLGDQGRIEQILINLVENAIKFTERGSVTLLTTCEQCDPERATIVWRVTDTGIGIPADRLDRLFAEFMQADSSITRRFGGTGLGLAISKRLVEQMKGTLQVESEVGTGTRFTLRLTLPCASGASSSADDADDTTARFEARIRDLGRPLHILFVEDDATNQYVATRLLKNFNIRIDMAGNGLEALDFVSRVKPDLICMDMRMPEMDGLEATRRIRQTAGGLADVPIIALTANAFKEDVDACLAAGMNRFVGKPIRRDLLLGAMLAELMRVGISPAPSPPPAVPENPKPASLPLPPAVDAEQFEEVHEMMGEDGVAELIETFEEETRRRLQRLRAGDQDIVTIAREMHTLKGAASTAAAPRLALLARTLEQAAKQGIPPTPDDLTAIADALDAFLAQVRTRNNSCAAAT